MKFLSLLCLILVFTASCSNDSYTREKAVSLKKVPDKVIRAFKTRHPDIETNFHKLKIDNRTSYEAHFVKDGKSLSETFSKKGTLLENEEEITFEEIENKTKVEEYLKTHDSEYQLTKVQKVISKKFKGHEIKVKTKKSRTGLMEYFFREDGSFHHQEEILLKEIPTLN